MVASDHTVLQFNPTPSSASLLAKVHPLVIFNICDCYVRRPDQAERVIVTLLDSVLPDGTVDIRNSYAVPHNESSDQVALDIDYHHNMLLSHQKVNPKEVIVGWLTEKAGPGTGPSKHTFGSISQEAYRQRMSKELGREVLLGEVICAYSYLSNEGKQMLLLLRQMTMWRKTMFVCRIYLIVSVLFVCV